MSGLNIKMASKKEFEQLKETEFKDYIEVDYDDRSDVVTLLHKDDYAKVYDKAQK